MINFNIHKRYLIYVSSFFILAIFSIRYINCLPFSGNMPLVSYEGVTRLGSYMIYAKEPFSFPLGLVKGAGFPFHDVDVLVTGAIPFFAIFFKIFSKIYAPLGEVYYFVLVELIAVFFTAWFTYLLLEKFKVKYFLLKFLGSTLCALSFTLLARSYYDQPLLLIHCPIYLAFIYSYIRLAERPSLKWVFAVLSVFFIAALFDPYVLLGISFMSFICIVFNFIDFLIKRDDLAGKNLIFIITALVLGIFLAVTLICLVDFFTKKKTVDNKKQVIVISTLIFGVLISLSIIFMIVSGTYKELYPGITCLGFGTGGGYHVADVFSLIIPAGLKYPGASYLAGAKNMITTDNLQAGQSAGFAYIGTVPLVLALTLLISFFTGLVKNIRSFLVRVKLNIASFLYFNVFLSPTAMISIAIFMLYVLSWGFVMHIFGHNVSGFIFTPAGMMAEMWRTLFHTRTLGRMAMPASLYSIIIIIALMSRHFEKYKFLCKKTIGKTFYLLVIIFLLVSHIYEIRAYLKPLKATKNAILSVFNENEARDIKSFLGDKKALFLIPNIGISHTKEHALKVGYLKTWDKICYAMVYHSGIPANTEDGGRVNSKHSLLMKLDEDSILKGDTKKIFDEYGDIAIISPYYIAKDIISKSNTRLKYDRIQDIIIMSQDK